MASGSDEVCTRYSFIIPFHHDLQNLARCLEALTPVRRGSEVIVAADGSTDDCGAVAAAHRARVVSLTGSRGPAVARNAAAAEATGDVLVFVDADVVVGRDGLKRLLQIFDEQPATAAVFGAYDDRPEAPGFVSQYKNLSHSLIHRTSASRARTFWSGFGAIRRPAFEAVGGFDERFDRPSVEDIDLGYRLTAAGYAVVLDPALSATHLKRWTIGAAIASDIFDRGIPWTQLIWRYRALDNDLNLRTEYRWSVVIAYLVAASMLIATHDRRALFITPMLIAGSMLLNRRHCQYLSIARAEWHLRPARG